MVLAGVDPRRGVHGRSLVKYPPNPPAVGDPGTLAERQGLHVAVICIAAALGLGATVLDRRLRAAGWPEHRRLPAVVAGVAVPMLLVRPLPPAPDEVSVPATLVWRFRVASLGANLTLWATLTLGLAWLVAEAQRRRSPAERGGGVAHHHLLTCRRPCGARRDATRPVAELVPFLRAGPAGPGDLLAANLIADPQRLANEIAATARGRGSETARSWRPCGGRDTRTAPPGRRWRPGWRARRLIPPPAGSGSASPGTGPRRSSSDRRSELADVDALVGRLFGGHLDPSGRAPGAPPDRAPAVWGNAAASIAAASAPSLRERRRSRHRRSHRRRHRRPPAPHGGLGSWVEPHRRYRRTTCCLWWKTSASKGALCEDCSLR